jgi:uncharacterized protein (TIGR00290 family)
MRRRAWMSWSSGKDSAFALERAVRQPNLEVTALLTTLSEAYSRVAMHGVREQLLERQAAAIGLPLVKVMLPTPCTNETYEAKMATALAGATRDGVDTVVFGDLFLADLRRYREEKLASVGMRAEFPLWGADTRELAASMVRAGLGAVLTCVDPKKLPRSFAGRAFDDALLAALPDGVDPCGENGEFHTFTWSCGAFREPVAIEVGETVERDGFGFADVHPR